MWIGASPDNYINLSYEQSDNNPSKYNFSDNFLLLHQPSLPGRNQLRQPPSSRCRYCTEIHQGQLQCTLNIHCTCQNQLTDISSFNNSFYKRCIDTCLLNTNSQLLSKIITKQNLHIAFLVTIIIHEKCY